MAKDTLVSSPRQASKIAQENEFSEDTKRELEDRIAGMEFKYTYAFAHAIAPIPSFAPKHARDITCGLERYGALLHDAEQLLAVVDGTGVFFAGHKKPVDKLGVGRGGVRVVRAEYDDVAGVARKSALAV